MSANTKKVGKDTVKNVAWVVFFLLVVLFIGTAVPKALWSLILLLLKP